jgi:hypothetical protein
MDQAHGSCGGPWAAAESGLTGTPVGGILDTSWRKEGEGREGSGHRRWWSFTTADGFKKNRGRGVDEAPLRRGREGGTDDALFISLHTWQGSARRDNTAEQEGGGGSASG